jgi:SAM-dependent methyltransferase
MTRRVAQHPTDERKEADEWARASEPLYRELSVIQALMDEVLDGRESARVLDAGCGAGRNLRIPADVHTVGIDISQRQLERNQHLTERILGDLQTYPLPERSYDLVICWDVLEHLPRPEVALHNMRRSLKDDGLMILALPNLISVKGVVTKFTPHAFHIWFHRHVYRSEKSGEDDTGPFPTFFRRAISPKGIRRFAVASALRVERFAMLESRWQRLARLRYRITGRIWKAIRFTVKCLTAGTVDLERTELIVVLAGPELRSDRAGIPFRRPALRPRP